MGMDTDAPNILLLQCAAAAVAAAAPARDTRTTTRVKTESSSHFVAVQWLAQQVVVQRLSMTVV
jgi:hypothetical protein